MADARTWQHSKAATGSLPPGVRGPSTGQVFLSLDAIQCSTGKARTNSYHQARFRWWGQSEFGGALLPGDVNVMEICCSPAAMKRYLQDADVLEVLVEEVREGSPLEIVGGTWIEIKKLLHQPFLKVDASLDLKDQKAFGNLYAHIALRQALPSEDSSRPLRGYSSTELGPRCPLASLEQGGIKSKWELSSPKLFEKIVSAACRTPFEVGEVAHINSTIARWCGRALGEHEQLYVRTMLGIPLANAVASSQALATAVAECAESEASVRGLLQGEADVPEGLVQLANALLEALDCEDRSLSIAIIDLAQLAIVYAPESTLGQLRFLLSLLCTIEGYVTTVASVATTCEALCCWRDGLTGGRAVELDKQGRRSCSSWSEPDAGIFRAIGQCESSGGMSQSAAQGPSLGLLVTPQPKGAHPQPVRGMTGDRGLSESVPRSPGCTSSAQASCRHAAMVDEGQWQGQAQSLMSAPAFVAPEMQPYGINLSRQQAVGSQTLLGPTQAGQPGAFVAHAPVGFPTDSQSPPQQAVGYPTLFLDGALPAWQNPPHKSHPSNSTSLAPAGYMGVGRRSEPALQHRPQTWEATAVVQPVGFGEQAAERRVGMLEAGVQTSRRQSSVGIDPALEKLIFQAEVLHRDIDNALQAHGQLRQAKAMAGARGKRELSASKSGRSSFAGNYDDDDGGDKENGGGNATTSTAHHLAGSRVVQQKQDMQAAKKGPFCLENEARAGSRLDCQIVSPEAQKQDSYSAPKQGSVMAESTRKCEIIGSTCRHSGGETQIWQVPKPSGNAQGDTDANKYSAAAIPIQPGAANDDDVAKEVGSIARMASHVLAAEDLQECPEMEAEAALAGGEGAESGMQQEPEGSAQPPGQAESRLASARLADGGRDSENVEEEGQSSAPVGEPGGPDLLHTIRLRVNSVEKLQAESGISSDLQPCLCWLVYRFSGDSKCLQTPLADWSENITLNVSVSHELVLPSGVKLGRSREDVEFQIWQESPAGAAAPIASGSLSLKDIANLKFPGGEEAMLEEGSATTSYQCSLPLQLLHCHLGSELRQPVLLLDVDYSICRLTDDVKKPDDKVHQLTVPDSAKTTPRSEVPLVLKLKVLRACGLAAAVEEAAMWLGKDGNALGRARQRGPNAFVQIMWPECFPTQQEAKSFPPVSSTATPHFDVADCCPVIFTESIINSLRNTDVHIELWHRCPHWQMVSTSLAGGGSSLQGTQDVFLGRAALCLDFLMHHPGAVEWLQLKSRTGGAAGAVQISVHTFYDLACAIPCRCIPFPAWVQPVGAIPDGFKGQNVVLHFEIGDCTLPPPSMLERTSSRNAFAFAFRIPGVHTSFRTAECAPLTTGSIRGRPAGFNVAFNYETNIVVKANALLYQAFLGSIELSLLECSPREAVHKRSSGSRESVAASAKLKLAPLLGDRQGRKMVQRIPLYFPNAKNLGNAEVAVKVILDLDPPDISLPNTSAVPRWVERQPTRLPANENAESLLDASDSRPRLPASPESEILRLLTSADLPTTTAAEVPSEPDSKPQESDSQQLTIPELTTPDCIGAGGGLSEKARRDRETLEAGPSPAVQVGNPDQQGGGLVMEVVCASQLHCSNAGCSRQGAGAFVVIDALGNGFGEASRVGITPVAPLLDGNEAGKASVCWEYKLEIAATTGTAFIFQVVEVEGYSAAGEGEKKGNEKGLGTVFVDLNAQGQQGWISGWYIIVNGRQEPVGQLKVKLALEGVPALTMGNSETFSSITASERSNTGDPTLDLEKSVHCVPELRLENGGDDEFQQECKDHLGEEIDDLVNRCMSLPMTAGHIGLPELITGHATVPEHKDPVRIIPRDMASSTTESQRFLTVIGQPEQKQGSESWGQVDWQSFQGDPSKQQGPEGRVSSVRLADRGPESVVLGDEAGMPFGSAADVRGPESPKCSLSPLPSDIDAVMESLLEQRQCDGYSAASKQLDSVDGVEACLTPAADLETVSLSSMMGKLGLSSGPSYFDPDFNLGLPGSPGMDEGVVFHETIEQPSEHLKVDHWNAACPSNLEGRLQTCSDDEDYVVIDGTLATSSASSSPVSVPSLKEQHLSHHGASTARVPGADSLLLGAADDWIFTIERQGDERELGNELALEEHGEATEQLCSNVLTTLRHVEESQTEGSGWGGKFYSPRHPSNPTGRHDNELAGLHPLLTDDLRLTRNLPQPGHQAIPASELHSKHPLLSFDPFAPWPYEEGLSPEKSPSHSHWTMRTIAPPEFAAELDFQASPPTRGLLTPQRRSGSAGGSKFPSGGSSFGKLKTLVESPSGELDSNGAAMDTLLEHDSHRAEAPQAAPPLRPAPQELQSPVDRPLLSSPVGAEGLGAGIPDMARATTWPLSASKGRNVCEAIISARNVSLPLPSPFDASLSPSEENWDNNLLWPLHVVPETFKASSSTSSIAASAFANKAGSARSREATSGSSPLPSSGPQILHLDATTPEDIVQKTNAATLSDPENGRTEGAAPAPELMKDAITRESRGSFESPVRDHEAGYSEEQGSGVSVGVCFFETEHGCGDGSVAAARPVEVETREPAEEATSCANAERVGLAAENADLGYLEVATDPASEMEVQEEAPSTKPSPHRQQQDANECGSWGEVEVPSGGQQNADRDFSASLTKATEVASKCIEVGDDAEQPESNKKQCFGSDLAFSLEAAAEEEIADSSRDQSSSTLQHFGSLVSVESADLASEPVHSETQDADSTDMLDHPLQDAMSDIRTHPAEDSSTCAPAEASSLPIVAGLGMELPVCDIDSRILQGPGPLSPPPHPAVTVCGSSSGGDDQAGVARQRAPGRFGEQPYQGAVQHLQGVSDFIGYHGAPESALRHSVATFEIGSSHGAADGATAADSKTPSEMYGSRDSLQGAGASSIASRRQSASWMPTVHSSGKPIGRIEQHGFTETQQLGAAGAWSGNATATFKPGPTRGLGDIGAKAPLQIPRHRELSQEVSARGITEPFQPRNREPARHHMGLGDSRQTPSVQGPAVRLPRRPEPRRRHFKKGAQQIEYLLRDV